MGKVQTIKERLRLHELWLDCEKNGVRLVECGDELVDADLQRAELQGANLWRANLWRADLREADLRGADLREADLREADLREADLRGANLRGANLRGANLRGADVDFSCWPLWCGSNHVIVDARIFRQLVDHLIVLDCDTDEARAAQKWLKENVRRSHRAADLGLWGT